MKILSLFILIFTLTLQLHASPIPLSFSSTENRSLALEKNKTEDTSVVSVASVGVQDKKNGVHFTSTHILVLVGLVAIYLLFLRRGESRNMRL